MPNDQPVHSLELLLMLDRPDHLNPWFLLSYVWDSFTFLRNLLGSKVPSIPRTVQGLYRGKIRA